MMRNSKMKNHFEDEIKFISLRSFTICSYEQDDEVEGEEEQEQKQRL